MVEEKHIHVPLVTFWTSVWAKGVTRLYFMQGAVRAVTWNFCKAQ